MFVLPHSLHSSAIVELGARVLFLVNMLLQLKFKTTSSLSQNTKGGLSNFTVVVGNVSDDTCYKKNIVDNQACKVLGHE
jgi:hypothetical protein